MKKTGRYRIFIILIFLATNLLLLNILYFGLLGVFGLGYDMPYHL